MRVVAHSLKIAVAAAVDDEGFVAPAKKVAKVPVPAVEPASVGPQQPLHAGDQVGLRRLDDQMKVIGHQAERVNVPARFFTSLPHRFQEPAPVMVIFEDGLAPVTADS